MKKERYSNCLFEAIRAKIKYGKNVKIIHIKPDGKEYTSHHWLWHNKIDNTICDWYQEYGLVHWYDWIFHKGHIRVRNYSAYERLINK